MENESTFVAPEGVYSVTDEHRPSQAQNIAASAGPHLHAAKISTIIIRYPTAKQSGGTQAFAQLLGGVKNEQKKEKSGKEKEDGNSLSSSDSPEDSDLPASSSQENTNANLSIPHEPHTLFSAQTAAGKKKAAARPKHNLKTTSSTFISRVQNAEGMTKTLQSKIGDVTFIFYNMAKSLVWIEAGSKAKVFRRVSPSQRRLS